MVAELLRLRLRLIGNLLRGRPAAVAARVFVTLIAIAGVVIVFVGISALRGSGSQFTARAEVSVGAIGTVAAFLIPLIVVRRELIPARAFLGYPVRSGVVALALPLLTLIGPAVLIVPVAFAPLRVWTSGITVLCAFLLIAQALLLLRLGAAAGAALRAFRRAGRIVRAAAVVLLIAAVIPAASVILTRAVLLVPDHIAPWARIALRVLRPVETSGIVDLVASSPVGVLWAAPAFDGLNQADRTSSAVWIGVAFVVVLAAAWAIVVVAQLRPTRRDATERARRVPGWFARMPATPAGAVAARSFTYWARDPRYRAVFGILPIIPVVTLLALWIGGVPLSVSALVPLPIMVLVLAWSTTHNDVAYDSTAMWQHLAAQTRGTHDRIGRLAPVLAYGGVLLLIGIPLTVWGTGDIRMAPAVIGVNVALLLGGLGVGSAMSARFPYAAPRPGDAAFRYPQVAGDAGGGSQGGSFLLAVLTAVPALAASGLWLMHFAGPWNWIALVLGVGVGGLVLLAGIRGGGRSFDRRAPELLAFTMRH